MLARLHVLLPFSLTVPEGEQFSIYEYLDDGYRVRVFPPLRSDRQQPPDRAGDLRMDGVPAFRADALRIDFQKGSLDRGQNTLFDPRAEVLERAVNSFLVRLRHVARASSIRPLHFPMVTWRIRYLNDDESELEKKDEALVRGRGGLQFSISWIALNKQVWEDVHSLPVDYEPPPWEELLLDAEADLPRIGPAVVLASSALEVFIAWALDRLAARSSIPAELWTWITERGDYLREPTVEEQFDILLRILAGHSLKTDAPALWEAFRNLKTARNTFVHEGRASVGGKTVSIETARRLVSAAVEIVKTVREWLPGELHWPVFRHSIQVETVVKLT